MKKDEINKMIQKAGPLRLGALVVCGVLLIVLSYGGVSFGVGEEDGGEGGEEISGDTGHDIVASQSRYREQMEGELVELLRGVEGVGNVEVMLTLKSSNEKVALKDNTEKGDSREEETVLIEDGNRNSSPYIIQEKEPELEGVVIVCEGGDDAGIKREITEAVSALFQIESHKIKIMKSKEAKE